MNVRYQNNPLRCGNCRRFGHHSRLCQEGMDVVAFFHNETVIENDGRNSVSHEARKRKRRKKQGKEGRKPENPTQVVGKRGPATPHAIISAGSKSRNLGPQTGEIVCLHVSPHPIELSIHQSTYYIGCDTTTLDPYRNAHCGYGTDFFSF